MSKPHEPQLRTAETLVEENSSKRPPKLVVLADLNDEPPEADDNDSLHVSPPDLSRSLSLSFSLFGCSENSRKKKRLGKMNFLSFSNPNWKNTSFALL